MKIEWTLESWGSDYPPENANEIICHGNNLIDAFAETHDEDETAAYSEWLWELYCSAEPGGEPRQEETVISSAAEIESREK